MRIGRLLFCWLLLTAIVRAQHPLVLQTDFGTKDGAVAAMKGVAMGIAPDLNIFDLTHENTPFDVWEAAYRLKQAAPYWPEGTVFVSVIDPGVGTERKSVVLKTKSGHLFVGPDNGTWMFIVEELGIGQVREIDESKNRRVGSEKSHTFHGRDVFVYVGAKLAAGTLAFADVGPELGAKVVELNYQKPRRVGGVLEGTIPYLDFNFGNVWTNLSQQLFQELKPEYGQRFRVSISQGDKRVYESELPYVRTFGDVSPQQPLLYVNSLLNVSFALNQGSFGEKHGIGSGAEWTVRVERVLP
jgi:S-adenosylmethionine hydrolase